MKTFINSISLFTAILFLTSAGCNNIKELEYKGIKNTKLQTLSINNAAIQMDLEYFNPNNFGLDVKETNLSIYLNDKFIGIADQPTKTQIEKNSTFLFPVVAHFDALKVVGSAFKAIFSKTNKVTIQGSAKVGKSGVYIKVPVNVTENVSLYNN